MTEVKAKIGTASPLYVLVRDIYETRGGNARSPLGLQLVITPIRREHSAPQRKGYHWLVNQWIELAELNVDHETMHHWICGEHWGWAFVTLPGGQEQRKPVRTTTQVWDADRAKYRKAQLPVDDYTELIEFAYRTAAEGGLVLPDLDPEKRARS